MIKGIRVVKVPPAGYITFGGQTFSKGNELELDSPVLDPVRVTDSIKDGKIEFISKLQLEIDTDGAPREGIKIHGIRVVDVPESGQVKIGGSFYSLDAEIEIESPELNPVEIGNLIKQDYIVII